MHALSLPVLQAMAPGMPGGRKEAKGSRGRGGGGRGEIKEGVEGRRMGRRCTDRVNGSGRCWEVAVLISAFHCL